MINLGESESRWKKLKKFTKVRQNRTDKRKLEKKVR